MKQLHYFVFILLAIASISLGSCKSSDDPIQPGVTNTDWQEGKALDITPNQVLTVKFNAAAKWEAVTASTWCSILPPASGEKGTNSIQLLTTTGTSTPRTSTINIKVEGHPDTNFNVTQQASVVTVSEDLTVNRKVDEYLKEKYLWNDEYKTLTLDYAKEYDAFFNDALMSMQTNTLDKKPYTGNDGKTYYSLFSYIDKRTPITKTRTAKLDKELSYSFGITGVTLVSIGTQSNYTIYFCIQGVYPDSPAAAAGIKRGAMISKINGNKINENNLEDYYYSLLMPDAVLSLTLTEDVIEKGKITESKNATLISKAMYLNPVITSQVDESDWHKIGYLVYSEFEASFDQELFDVFKEFKSQNVTDLILDLRYNGGGHTMSANLITSCIAADASVDKVFISLRYNAERMAKLKNQKEIELFAYPNHYPNLDGSLTAGGLGLQRVYCLVGNNTASASELVINALQGIDLEVILIGEKTTGKNVGMEYEDYPVEEHIYRIAPISFQSYNAKDFGDYENGFSPIASLTMEETNPFNEEGVFYILKDYGTDEEPLYAKAIELITGKNPMPITKSVKATLKGQIRPMPAIYRPGYNGMLRMNKE